MPVNHSKGGGTYSMHLSVNTRNDIVACVSSNHFKVGMVFMSLNVDLLSLAFINE